MPNAASGRATFAHARERHLRSSRCYSLSPSVDDMGAANRREAPRPRGFTSISTVMRSLPNFGSGVKNYVHHVRFAQTKTSARAHVPTSRDISRLSGTRWHRVDSTSTRRRCRASSRARSFHARSAGTDPPVLRSSRPTVHVHPESGGAFSGRRFFFRSPRKHPKNRIFSLKSTRSRRLAPLDPSQAVILFFSVMIVASLTMAFTYVPAKVKRPPFAVRRSDKCFQSDETVCDTHAVSRFYFWNLTNAAEVVSGAEPPRLVEVGPYVLRDGKEKKSDIEFHPARDDSDEGTHNARPASVSYVSTSYARWDFEAFGEGRALSDVIVSFNPAYATLIKMYGSEINFLYSLSPKVLAGVLDGMVSVFQALAATPATAAAMPHLVAAAADASGESLKSLAHAQWADCSVLGGASIVDLALPVEVLAKFPIAPELCAYVRAATNGSVANGLGSSASSAIRGFLTDGDEAGSATLRFLGAPVAVSAAMIDAFARSVNDTANLTATQAALTKGYVDAVARSYGKAAASAAIGPFLNPTSSGMFIARSAEEWVLGYADPLTSSRFPTTDPRFLVRAVTKTFLHDDIGLGANASHAIDRVPRAVQDRSQWPGLGATPWVLATGADRPERALDVLESTGGAGATKSGDASVYAYSLGNETHYERVAGKYAARAVYLSVKEKSVQGAPDVTAWLDFGSSLDFGRSVSLEFQGSSWFAHEAVELHVFRLRRDSLLPCPVSLTNCAFGSNAYGAFNVTSHRSIPTVTTMPHGFDADPRLWGFANPLAPKNTSSNPFSPEAEKHQIEWDVFELSGDVLGMRLRYQNNFLVSPTDVFYPNLWKPPADSDAFDKESGVYLPIAWADVSWRAPQTAIDDIAAIIKEATGLTIVYMIGLPGASFLFVAYHSFALYVKRRVARGQKQVRDEVNKRELDAEKTRERRGRGPNRLAVGERRGPPPLGPSVVEKSEKPFDDEFVMTDSNHRDDVSVVVVDVHGRR